MATPSATDHTLSPALSIAAHKSSSGAIISTAPHTKAPAAATATATAATAADSASATTAAPDHGLAEHVDIPENIEVYGARVHNLKNVNVKVPLQKMVAIAGVSGSGKSSLALGTLYAEGSRRYLQSLSTYTRRRISEASKPDVDEVMYVPAALALRQRPGVPSMRSTFGTGTELLNTIRLIFSRLATRHCKNGHVVPPTIAVAAMLDYRCPECGEEIPVYSAEDYAFNGRGACPHCHGTGMVREVDESTLIDPELTIDEGAVRPWGTLMWSLMTDVCRAMGVRTNVPYKDLSADEKEIVMHGPAQKKHILYHNKTTGQSTELDFTFYNAVYTVENALSKVKDEKGMKRVERFLKVQPCPHCGGSRFAPKLLEPTIKGSNIAQVCALSLYECYDWVQGLPEVMPADMREMTRNMVEAFNLNAHRLLELGLGYLSLDRATSTLSNGERQRMQLARAVRNRTTGVLYVLDEPSIGLHPANLVGLLGVVRDLLHDGNSVIVVDHDTQVLVEADYMIEMGPAAGANGGQIFHTGTIAEIMATPDSTIGPFLKEAWEMRQALRQTDATVASYLEENQDYGRRNLQDLPNSEQVAQMATARREIVMTTRPKHSVNPLEVHVPLGKLTVVTGVSGSGKTTMVLESLIPALQATINGTMLPVHVAAISAPTIKQVKLIDATPIGLNVRSTLATYANVLDELRKVYAHTAEAKALGYKAGDFSYNTGKLRCPYCDGTGTISLDVQFLPDVDIPCPQCHGKRYAPEAQKVSFEFIPEQRNDKGEVTAPALRYTLPQLLELDIDSALKLCRLHKAFKLVVARLEVLSQLGLGYLTLGEATPNLSGGEAQRLKLASEMGRAQGDSVFIFDEPTIGLHPLDVKSLLQVIDSLIAHQATVIVIEHDRDLIAHADHIIDMGPSGGRYGGNIVATGTPEEVAHNPHSLTGRFLHLAAQ